MHFPPTHRSFPRIHHQQWWHSHGRGEGGGHFILVPSYHHQRVTTVLRTSPVHCQLQHHHQSPHRPAQRQGLCPGTPLPPKHITPSRRLLPAQGTPPRLHPCAFFSRNLRPAEKNYDIGNRELLAIKLALEEWRHWLEGAAQPFLVLTDHKNLQYLRDAKRLNPRQARWALFFTHFQFKISYRPGPRNIKGLASMRT